MFSRGAGRADAAAADPSSSRARRRPSTAAPSTGVVFAALVRLACLTGHFVPFRVCQTGDHRCLHIRCLLAVPRVAPRGTAQGRTFRLPPPRPCSRRTRCGPDGRGEATGRSASRCDARKRRTGRASGAAGRSTRQGPCLSSTHADLPQVAGIRLRRRSVASGHRSRAGDRARHRHCSDASRAACIGWHPEGMCSRADAGGCAADDFTRSSRGRSSHPATCVGARCTSPHPRSGGACQARRGRASFITAVCHPDPRPRHLP